MRNFTALVTLIALASLTNCATPVRTEIAGLITYKIDAMTVSVRKEAANKIFFSVACTSTAGACNWIGLGFNDHGNMPNSLMILANSSSLSIYKTPTATSKSLAADPNGGTITNGVKVITANSSSMTGTLDLTGKTYDYLSNNSEPKYIIFAHAAAAGAHTNTQRWSVKMDWNAKIQAFAVASIMALFALLF